MNTFILAALLMMQEAPTATTRIVANPESHVYHVRCSHVDTCKKCGVKFTTETEAKTAGYHICPFAKKVKP